MKFWLIILQLVGYSIKVHQRSLLSLPGHVSTLLQLGLQNSDKFGNRFI